MKTRSLRTYRNKRAFNKTPEPRGKKNVRKKKLSFCVQKHDASHLHYDFRLELDGVLLSWAVPKGPSLDPTEKRLAVHVEDHPVEYGSFEGTIPEGEYGAGTVLLWDRGEWEPIGDARKDYERGALDFQLHGEKLKGLWKLRRMGRLNEGKKNWLLMKSNDEFATKRDVLRSSPRSVRTGRTIEEVAFGTQRKSKSTAKAAVNLAGNFLLATAVEKAPEGSGWVHEVKYDGYRVQVERRDDKVRMLTRGGKDYTQRVPHIVDAIKKVRTNSFTVDAELVVYDERGRSSFPLLQNALSEKKTEGAMLVVFDVLERDGNDLRALPLSERTKELKKLIGRGEKGRVTLSKQIDHSGTSVIEHACKLGLEGIISKRSAGRYVTGRSKEWLKIKCRKRQEFVIGGFSPSTNTAYPFGALLLGYYDDKTFRYAGKVGTGFSAALRRDLGMKLKRLVMKSSPFGTSISKREATGVVWVKPQLIAEIEFVEWTKDERLRHPAFLGLREDKRAKDVTRDDPPVAPKKKGRTAESFEIHGVTITNPDRPLLPGTSVTKRQAAEFYLRHEKDVLKHFANRPLVLLRCPKGGSSRCFYQKHATASIPEEIPRVLMPEGKGMKEYLHVKTIEHVVTLVQLNVIEFHSWSSTVSKPEAPAYMLFDLDPALEVGWSEVVEAAKDLRRYLKMLSLESVPKSTGGKGIHVVVPIAQRYSFNEVKELSKDISQNFSEQHPGRFTLTMSKSKRRGKIFIDYLRNGQGASSVLPFSLRARADTPVALPLKWTDLIKVEGAEWTIERIASRRALNGWEKALRAQLLGHAIKVVKS